MTGTWRTGWLPGLVIAMAIAPGLLTVRAGVTDPADDSIRMYLSQDDRLHLYRGSRRMEVVNGSRSGWLEAVTELSPKGFHYEVRAEGGSNYIRNSVLRAVLDAERDVIARGQAGRMALRPENYTFQPNGVDADGLANVLLSPRRKEHTLVEGTMFLRPGDGELVRLEGRLAKSPSFWVKNVNIVRSYDRVNGVLLPVTVESTAQLRLLGSATLHITYDYSTIDGQAVTPVETLARK